MPREEPVISMDFLFIKENLSLSEPLNKRLIWRVIMIKF